MKSRVTTATNCSARQPSALPSAQRFPCSAARSPRTRATASWWSGWQLTMCARTRSALFRYDAEDVEYERMRGGLTREIVTRPNGVRVHHRSRCGRICASPREGNARRTSHRSLRHAQRGGLLPSVPAGGNALITRSISSLRSTSSRPAGLHRELFYDTFEALLVYESEERYDAARRSRERAGAFTRAPR